jgi:hypothetical protein
MSVGPSENIDEPDGTNEAGIFGGEDEQGKIACKPFSKVLIVHAI